MLSASTSHADVVLLSNGDRVSGVIEKLDKEKLSLKTEFAGTIQIDWKKVAQLESDKEYDVEADSGQKIRGKLERAPERRDRADAGECAGSADARLRQVGESSAAVGRHTRAAARERECRLQFCGGNNNVSNSTASANIRYRTEDYQVTLDAQSLFNRRDEPDADQPLFRQACATTATSVRSPSGSRSAASSTTRSKKPGSARPISAAGSAGSCCSEAKHEANLLGGRYLRQRAVSGSDAHRA